MARQHKARGLKKKGKPYKKVNAKSGIPGY